MGPMLPWILPGIDLGHFVEMVVLVFGAAILQGIGGVGFAMVAAPISLLLFPQLVPGPILVLGTGLALLGALREHANINWPSVGAAMTGRFSGTILAGLTLSMLPAGAFSIMFAILILVGVAFSFGGWRVATTARNMVAAGFVSGIMGTITSSGAPPFTIVMQHMPPHQLRPTISSIFFLGALFSLVILHAVGRFGAPELRLGLVLLPAMAAGFAVSGPLKQMVSHGVIRMGLLLLTAAGALGILARTWVGL